ncbi:MAG: ketoacyl-ACP synthase III [Candidatus Viridilinea halotolerans]|uniref:Ketoacyl-ACP synthase III n=1 Tax=Candidatus Viridilinea halotolerans TaxID=2491704 RepID=A0A426TT33_9CHLR|nr:MAG: ketoacyl-ACP synthase III [Candidatus Viridilinea halotolerans]
MSRLPPSITMLKVKIAGLGHYLPEHVVSSAQLEAEYGLEPGWILRTTGIAARHRALTETTVAMAQRAAQRALAAAGMTARDVDLIIAAASGRQQAIPCTAAFIQRAIGAPDGGSACFDLDATCLSFIFGLQTAAHLVAAGSYRTALIVSSEITRRSLNPREPQSAVLFGDAAAAAVLVRTPAGESARIVWEQFATHSSGADLTTIQGGGTLHHPNDPTTTPEMNTFSMQGTGVYKKAARLVSPFMEQFFAQTGWTRAEVDAVVPHQASGHALDLLTARYGFTPAQVVRNLAERGNCVAASIPLAFSEAVASGRIQRGQRVMLVGTGAGLTIGALGLVF